MAYPRLFGVSAPPRPGMKPHPGLEEAAALWWREPTDERSQRRDGRLWTLWTTGVVGFFVAPGIALLYIEPLTLPAALGCFAHAWAVPAIQARRGARSVRPLGGEPETGPDRVALGLLGDLVGHEERELLRRTGLVLERGKLGVWLVGEQGAFLVRPHGRRVDCRCVRVTDASELPAGDRVAHLLLALREDELGFAKVANLAFSGAPWRVRRKLPERARPALDAARAVARRSTADR